MNEENNTYSLAKKDTIKGLVLSIALLICEFLPYYICLVKEESEEGTQIVGTDYYSIFSMPICWGYLLITVLLVISWYNNYYILKKELTIPEEEPQKKNFLFRHAIGKRRFVIGGILLLSAPIFIEFLMSYVDWAMDESGYWGSFSHSISFYLFPIIVALLAIHSVRAVSLSKIKEK